MPLKMMRSNVLVDLGETVAPWKSEIIVAPEIIKRKNVIGTVLSVGPKCRLFDAGSIGKKCVVKAFHHADQELTPEASARLGLRETWHVIAHENQIDVMLEEVV